MKNIICIFVTHAFFSSLLFAQVPYIQWQRCFGGSNEDYDGNNSLILTNDGGYFLTGTSSSSDGDVSGYHPGWVNGWQTNDGWVLKLDSIGNIQWQRALGGSFTEELNAAVQTPDGGYLVVGYTTSIDGDVSGNHGGNCGLGYCGDGWVVKLDSLGNIQWQKCYGGSETDYFASITLTPQGTYLLAGETISNDGDVSGNHLPPFFPVVHTQDIWLVEIDSTGNILWQKCYGGWGKETLREARFIAPDKYLILGGTNSIDGDVSGLHGFQMDIWVFCIDLTGQLLWQRCIGTEEIDYPGSVAQLHGGNYLVTGDLWSGSSYDSSCRIDTVYSSVPLMTLNGSGQILNSQCFGGSGSDAGRQILLYDSSQIIVSSNTVSVDGDVIGNHGNAVFGTVDYWLMGLDTSLNLLWSQCFGGSNDEYNNIMLKTLDGGLVLSGSTDSNDGEVSGYHGGSYDIWLLKLYFPSEYEAMLIVQPIEGHCTLSDSEQVSIQVINLGKLDFYNFPVSYSINGGIPVTEIVSDTLQPGDTLLYSFNTRADFSIPGSYMLSVNVTVSGDAHAFNDNAEIEVVSVDHLSIPMSMGFENHENFAGYSIIDLDVDGRSGSISTLFPNSGSNSFTFWPAITFTPDNMLWTSCIDMNAATNYFLSYRMKEYDAMYPYSLEVYLNTQTDIAGATLLSSPPIPADTLYTHIVNLLCRIPRLGLSEYCRTFFR